MVEDLCGESHLRYVDRILPVRWRHVKEKLSRLCVLHQCLCFTNSQSGSFRTHVSAQNITWKFIPGHSPQFSSLEPLTPGQSSHFILSHSRTGGACARTSLAIFGNAAPRSVLSAFNRLTKWKHLAVGDVVVMQEDDIVAAGESSASAPGRDGLVHVTRVVEHTNVQSRN